MSGAKILVTWIGALALHLVRVLRLATLQVASVAELSSNGG